MIGERRFVLEGQLARARQPALDAVELDLLARIVDGVELGASRHVELTHALLVHASAGAPERFRAVAGFVAETRGAEAPIVANAVHWLLADPVFSPERLMARAGEWARIAAEIRSALVAAAIPPLRQARALVLYDYSGTVADIVRGLAAVGAAPRLVVPESRSIEGGARYVEALRPLGLPMRLIFDAALEQDLPGADALLLGAESLGRDGSLVNTLGSRGAARLARAHGVRVYCCAELLKLQRTEGDPILPAARDFRARLLGAADWANAVDCSQHELEQVPAELIDVHLTERGPLTPRALKDLP